MHDVIIRVCKKKKKNATGLQHLNLLSESRDRQAFKGRKPSQATCVRFITNKKMFISVDYICNKTVTWVTTLLIQVADANVYARDCLLEPVY